jgi:hypothetical protein
MLPASDESTVKIVVDTEREPIKFRPVAIAVRVHLVAGVGSAPVEAVAVGGLDFAPVLGEARCLGYCDSDGIVHCGEYLYWATCV